MNSIFNKSGMNRQIKSFSMSFAIHALIFFALLGVSRSITVSKPVVIDFTIESSVRETVSDAMPAKKNTGPAKRVSRKSRLVSHEISKPESISHSVSETPAPVSEPVHEALPSKDVIDEQRAQQQTFQNADSAEGSDTAKGTSSESASAEEIAGNTSERYIELNYTYIKEKIQKSISYPLMAKKMGMEGKAVVSFIVDEKGDVSEMKIVKSSGFNILDRNVIETIKKILPFPSSPLKVELIVPVIYRLN